MSVTVHCKDECILNAVPRICHFPLFILKQCFHIASLPAPPFWSMLSFMDTYLFSALFCLILCAAFVWMAVKRMRAGKPHRVFLWLARFFGVMVVMGVDSIFKAEGIILGGLVVVAGAVMVLMIVSGVIRELGGWKNAEQVSIQSQATEAPKEEEVSIQQEDGENKIPESSMQRSENCDHIQKSYFWSAIIAWSFVIFLLCAGWFSWKDYILPNLEIKNALQRELQVKEEYESKFQAFQNWKRIEGIEFLCVMDIFNDKDPQNILVREREAALRIINLARFLYKVPEARKKVVEAYGEEWTRAFEVTSDEHKKMLCGEKVLEEFYSKPGDRERDSMIRFLLLLSTDAREGIRGSKDVWRVFMAPLIPRLQKEINKVNEIFGLELQIKEY